MPDLKQISDDADMIVCGFAYKKTDEGIRVFDLNNGKVAADYLTLSIFTISKALPFALIYISTIS